MGLNKWILEAFYAIKYCLVHVNMSYGNWKRLGKYCDETLTYIFTYQSTPVKLYNLSASVRFHNFHRTVAQCILCYFEAISNMVYIIATCTYSFI